MEKVERIRASQISRLFLTAVSTALPTLIRSSSQLTAHAFFSHLPRVSTMASSQRPKGRDGDISTLDMLIQTLNVAKGACGIPPAQIVFGSAGVLLAMIRVRFPLPCQDELLKHCHPGQDGQPPGLRRSWADLRQCMRSTPRWIEGETIG